MEKLSATEFARLTALLTKGSALTPEEQTEKAALESKILAERASDQDPPAPAPSDTGESEDDPADDAGEETPPADGEPVEGDVDPASAAFTGLTVGQKFRALLTSRAGLMKTLGQTRTALVTAQAQIVTLIARAAAAETALATAQTSLTEATARVTTLEAEKKDLNAAVTDELAGLGVPRQDLVAGLADGETSSPVESAYEAFRTAETPEAKAAAHVKLKAAQAAAKAKAKAA